MSWTVSTLPSSRQRYLFLVRAGLCQIDVHLTGRFLLHTSRDLKAQTHKMYWENLCSRVGDAWNQKLTGLYHEVLIFFFQLRVFW